MIAWCLHFVYICKKIIDKKNYGTSINDRKDGFAIEVDV